MGRQCWLLGLTNDSQHMASGSWGYILSARRVRPLKVILSKEGLIARDGRKEEGHRGAHMSKVTMKEIEKANK